MGDVLNFRMKRKQKARTEKEHLAAQNRLLYGRTRAEREAERRGEMLENKRHEGHRLSRNDGDR